MFSCNLRCRLIFLHSRSRTYQVAGLRAGPVGHISCILYFNCEHVRCVTCDLINEYTSNILCVTCDLINEYTSNILCVTCDLINEYTSNILCVTCDLINEYTSNILSQICSNS